MCCSRFVNSSYIRAGCAVKSSLIKVMIKVCSLFPPARHFDHALDWILVFKPLACMLGVIIYYGDWRNRRTKWCWCMTQTTERYNRKRTLTRCITDSFLKKKLFICACPGCGPSEVIRLMIKVYRTYSLFVKVRQSVWPKRLKAVYTIERFDHRNFDSVNRP